jgi:hypothetical protein
MLDSGFAVNMEKSEEAGRAAAFARSPMVYRWSVAILSS